MTSLAGKTSRSPYLTALPCWPYPTIWMLKKWRSPRPSSNVPRPCARWLGISHNHGFRTDALIWWTNARKQSWLRERLLPWSAPSALAAPPQIDSLHTPMIDIDHIEQVKLAAGSLKNGKASGLDQITAEAIKAGDDVLLKRFHMLIQMIWQSDCMPLRWKKAFIINSSSSSICDRSYVCRRWWQGYEHPVWHHLLHSAIWPQDQCGQNAAQFWRYS